MPLRSIDRWRVALAPYISGDGLPVLDIGAGPGLWSEALATWFDASMVGVEATAEPFATAGFVIEAMHSVPEQVADDLDAYYERIRVRANSTLTLISFAEGLAALGRDAQAYRTEAVVDHRDLLVLRPGSAQ